MGSPIISSLRDLLILKGAPEHRLPDPDRMALYDALRMIRYLCEFQPSPVGDPGANERAGMGLFYLSTLERSFKSEAAPDHARRGMG